MRIAIWTLLALTGTGTLILFLTTLGIFNINKESSTLTSIPSPEFSAWIPWWDEERAITSLERTGKKLKFILPVWYRVDENGKISEISSNLKDKILKKAIDNNLSIIPTISNASTTGFDPERVSILVSDQNLRKEEVENLVNLANKKGFGGWDLDFEQVYEKDRENYSKFVSVLSENLHKEGLLLSVTVHAQTGSVYDWEGTKGQDIKSIGKYADFVRIMAYDFHNQDSLPGPITPLSWLESILEYAVDVLPTEKIVLALPTYGYDWSEAKVKPVQYTDAVDLLNQQGKSWERDKKSHALTGEYDAAGEKHTLWFEDADSLKKKIEIAKKFGIYQFALWRLGGEDPKIWEKLEQNN